MTSKVDLRPVPPTPPQTGHHGATLVVENDIKFPLYLKVEIIRGYKGPCPLDSWNLGLSSSERLVYESLRTRVVENS